MQVWQESLAAAGVTLFTNPLSPNTPLQALTDGSHTRQRMAMDVFATNAIRAIRMQSPRVGVVIAARAGGQILFGFNATDSAFEVVPQVFVWNLSSSDNIAIIQHNFLDLMAECRVEHIRILHDVLPENADLPTYAQSLSLTDTTHSSPNTPKPPMKNHSVLFRLPRQHLPPHGGIRPTPPRPRSRCSPPRQHRQRRHIRLARRRKHAPRHAQNPRRPRHRPSRFYQQQSAFRRFR